MSWLIISPIYIGYRQGNLIHNPLVYILATRRMFCCIIKINKRFFLIKISIERKIYIKVLKKYISKADRAKQDTQRHTQTIEALPYVTTLRLISRVQFKRKKMNKIKSEDHLRIAIQKKGRLSDQSVSLLRSCGVKIDLNTQRLIAHCKNMPIDILRVRDDDIPGLVMNGMVDLGFIGQNVLEEERMSRHSDNEPTAHKVVKKLNFGDCRFSIAVANDFDYKGPESLAGLRIATTYTHILKRFMSEKNIPYSTCVLAGSVEVAPRAGLADAICDLVSTGATLEANGLKEVEVIYRSTAILIQKDEDLSTKKQNLVDRLLIRIDGMQKAKESKYIMLNAPKKNLQAISNLLPGSDLPTVMELAGSDDRVALHAVSKENIFWETMEELKKLGASSILVLPIEKMMV